MTPQLTQTRDFVDPFDFCRACKGSGVERESLGGGKYISGPCYLCRGSGNRTVRVTPIMQENAQ